MITEVREEFDILLAGVGGQGTVLASRILAEAAVKAGFSVKTSETIGMAQREGSVTSHVRIGQEVWSPLISPGGADLLVGLEPAEAARNLGFLQKDGTLLVNEGRVLPVTVAAGISKYDTGRIREYLLASCPGRVKFFDGTALARAAGNEKTLNAVMLGALCALNVIPLARELILESLLGMVPPRTAQMNQEAFNLGYETVRHML